MKFPLKKGTKSLFDRNRIFVIRLAPKVTEVVGVGTQFNNNVHLKFIQTEFRAFI